MRPFLIRQVTAPVRWTDCVARMAREGCQTFVEVGPGKVLTGLLRRIDGAPDGLAVEDVAGLDKALAALAGRVVSDAGAPGDPSRAESPWSRAGRAGSGAPSWRPSSTTGPRWRSPGAMPRRSRRSPRALERRAGKAVGLVAEMGRAEDVQRIVAETDKRFDRLDLLVNNAGITKDGLLIRMKDADWDEVLGVNLRAAFQATRAAARLMIRQRSGRIVNVTSAAGVMGTAGQANYAAAKAGLIGLTKSTARELAHWGILVNAVAPGLIETDMAAALSAEMRRGVRRAGSAEAHRDCAEVAEVVRFLASEGAGYITGQVIHVNGGLYM